MIFGDSLFIRLEISAAMRIISGTRFLRVDPAAEARSCSSSLIKDRYCDSSSFNVGLVVLRMVNVVVIVDSVGGATYLVVSTC